MHINLLLGLVVLLAAWWLIRSRQNRKTAQKKPAAMLLDEIGKRRAVRHESKRASEKLMRLKAERLRPVVEGVRDMIHALDEEGGAQAQRLRLTDEGRRAELEICHCGAEETETLILEWDVRDLDLDFFAAEDPLPDAQGDYIIRTPDGALLREAELTPFMRRLSGLIADRLA
ncbi:MAG: hypothetical protein LBD82_02140 [Deltaproteobacteria bacterium]|jgi:hypothetical protein|nr:hypothetical protein [Deltaproteobacteria bacterium]